MKVNQFWAKSISSVLSTILLVLFANLQAWSQTPLNDLVEKVNFKFDSKSRTMGNSWKDVQLPTNAIYGRFIISKANLGKYSKVIFTSYKDGQQQVLTGGQLREWGNSSAYFNGNQLSVQVIQDSRDKGHVFLEMEQMIVGYPTRGIKSQCGSTDDRIPSNDAAVGRIVPVGCTGWLITNGKMVTAGHCTGSSAQILEFNVPASNSNGSIVHPPVKDQYPLLASSLQTGYPSEDWAVYNLGTNSETGLTALAAQNKSFNVVQTNAANTIRITGFGVEKSSNNPYNPTRNQTQQTHTGPFSSATGTKLYYATDTEGGNSGSPVIDEATGNAIGVHTHGGCSTGSNSGTNAQLQSFWNAMGLGDGNPDPGTYCVSKGNNVSDEYISKVVFGSINKSSDGGNGYSNFTTTSTDVALNSTTTISITPTWTGTKYNEAYSVWIDFNQDGDFGDAGEQVFTKAASQVTPVTGNITIPANAKKGTTRMRVSMKYNAIPTSCETFTYGEVEDYTVNITTGTPPAPTYCASKGNNVSDEYISKVVFGSINNSSDGSNGYTDFTSTSTSIAPGSSATITITPTWTGTVYSEGYSVWIDFNRDGDFTDAGEQVFTQSATQSTSVSGTISIPASATTGATRMRVSMKYNAVPTSCENFTYGEVEDYTVNIGGASVESVAKNLPAETVVLYPSPAKSGQNINMRSNQAGQVYTVMSALGRVVLSGKVSDSNFQINTSKLGKGLYILRVGKSTRKFLID
ncbi:GEVED domain-containing protein [uncultured Microscilla sp.]|uniref:GEVED domain-containing protein n=1 Tax=uncultured Microscilla sp. TaxID=432653 RepID=UPI0026325F83|nr:GEVED domain-containing protein [uncultured Microscilla sp.]